MKGKEGSFHADPDFIELAVKLFLRESILPCSPASPCHGIYDFLCSHNFLLISDFSIIFIQPKRK